ncbi:hypothetical protein VTK56DRAFT_1550 [Thermocarpiscus australiensis]
MYLKPALLFSLASSLVFPVTAKSNGKAKRGVLTVQDYWEFQVSDGVAGNAPAEVSAKFPIDQSDPASVDAEDLAIVNAARKTAEDAETDAGGFNDAIEAAGGEDKVLLEVLKMRVEVLALQIDADQECGLSGEQSAIGVVVLDFCLILSH